MSTPSLLPSELILNPDGSIYHLHLRPEQVAPLIITVGDPYRVEAVSRNFDKVEYRIQKREFITHTGIYSGKRMTVISTGIGPDNIDIVLNELDALFNIDFEKREIRDKPVSLKIVRIGTSGSLRADLDVDQFLFSAAGIGLDNLMQHYAVPDNAYGDSMVSAFGKHLREAEVYNPIVYAFGAGEQLLDQVADDHPRGITLTSPGFYGPQGRQLRLRGPLNSEFLDAAAAFTFHGINLTNFEMETAAIYGLSHALGHQALSCNVILANRHKGSFSSDPNAAVDRLIRYVLDRLVID